MKIPEIKLKKTLRNDALERHYLHPWFFSGSLNNEPGNIEPGSIVKIFDAGGTFICYGHYNPKSSIRVRGISWKEDEIPDTDYILSKITKSFELRNKLHFEADSWRVVFSESDGLPGLVIDKFGDFGVIQTTTAGMDNLKRELAESVIKICGFKGVVERNDCEIRGVEGLPFSKGMLAGENPPEELLISENNLKFSVNLLSGQKTGFYLDQRDNRFALSRFAKPGMELLDAFCFSGAFSIYCASKGVSSFTFLDDSQFALELAEKNMAINGFKDRDSEFVCGDAFSILRKFRDSRRSFDMIVLDPPKFAPTRKDVDRAARGYKDINLLGMKLLREDGILATFSCSSGISRERFRIIIENAARDSGKEVAILATLGQGADHPVPIHFPESEYLKGFICRVR